MLPPSPRRLIKRFTRQSARRSPIKRHRLSSQTGALLVQAGATAALSGTFTNFASGTLTGGTYALFGTLQFAGAAVTNAARCRRASRSAMTPSTAS